ncbi:hypothetical protein PMI14_03691, partial [Acidovorax sp. CF316]
MDHHQRVGSSIASISSTGTGLP